MAAAPPRCDECGRPAPDGDYRVDVPTHAPREAAGKRAPDVKLLCRACSARLDMERSNQ